MGKIAKRSVSVLLSILMLISMLAVGVVSASAAGPGTVIYYDNSVTNWDTVGIYCYGTNNMSNPTAMTKVTDNSNYTNLWKYTLTSTHDNVIFVNGTSWGKEQTGDNVTIESNSTTVYIAESNTNKTSVSKRTLITGGETPTEPTPPSINSAPTEVLNGTNIMFYVGMSWGPNPKFGITDGSNDIASATKITGNYAYVNVAKSSLPSDKNLYVTNNIDGDYNGRDTGIKANTAQAGALYYHNGSNYNDNVAATTINTLSLDNNTITQGTASVTANATLSKTTPAYGSDLYVQYYINNALVGTSAKVSSTSVATSIDTSSLSAGAYTVQSVLTDGTVYYLGNTAELTVNGDTPVTTYTMSATSDNANCTATVSPETVTAGSSATFSVTYDNTKYTFNGWYNGSTQVSTDESYVVTPTGNLSLTAKFTEKATEPTVELKNLPKAIYYFDNSKTNWSQVYIVVGRITTGGQTQYSKAYSMTQIAGSNVFQWDRSGLTYAWENYTHFFFTDTLGSFSTDGSATSITGTSRSGNYTAYQTSNPPTGQTMFVPDSAGTTNVVGTWATYGETPTEPTDAPTTPTQNYYITGPATGGWPGSGGQWNTMTAESSTLYYYECSGSGAFKINIQDNWDNGSTTLPTFWNPLRAGTSIGDEVNVTKTADSDADATLTNTNGYTVKIYLDTAAQTVYAVYGSTPTATYNVKVGTFGEVVGTASVSAKTVSAGGTVTFTATNAGYAVFEGWYDSNTETATKLSSDNPYTYTAPTDLADGATITLYAKFNKDENAFTIPYAKSGTLYVHAIADVNSNDTDGWSKVETYSGTNYFFLPTTADSSVLEIYNTYSSSVTVTGNGGDPVTIPANGRATVGYTPNANITVSGAANMTIKVMKSSTEGAVYINNTTAAYGFTADNPAGFWNWLASNKSNEAKNSTSAIATGNKLTPATAKKMKGRGNTTWTGTNKKPFNITFSNPVTISGMTANKWSFLANYQDASLMRNRIIYDLSNEIGLPWSPDSRFVDFYVNGEYKGSYQASEKVEIGTGQMVDLTEPTADDSANPTNQNFIVEVDAGGEDTSDFALSGTKFRVVAKAPDPNDTGMAYMGEVMNQKYGALENALYNGDLNTLAGLIDMESLAKQYIIQELSKNSDGGLRSTYFTYNAAEEKFYAAPVWDFDITLGNLLNGRSYATQNPDGWITKTLTDGSLNPLGQAFNLTGSFTVGSTTYTSFEALVKDVWTNTVYPAAQAAASKISTYETSLADSAAMNYVVWPLPINGNKNDQGENITWLADMSNNSLGKTYDKNFAGTVDYAADWMTARTTWMNSQLSTGDTPTTSYDVYLTGDNFDSWNFNNQYKLTELGENTGVYYITLNSFPGGQFKFAGFEAGTTPAWDSKSFEYPSSGNYNASGTYQDDFGNSFNDFSNKKATLTLDTKNHTIKISTDPATTYTVTANAETGGQVSKDNSTFASTVTADVLSGGTVTLYAKADAGYTFDGWYNGATKVSSETTFTTPAISAAVTYTAKFTSGSSGDAGVTGATIYVRGNYNSWGTGTAMTETSPGVYELTIDNYSDDAVSGQTAGFKFATEDWNTYQLPNSQDNFTAGVSGKVKFVLDTTANPDSWTATVVSDPVSKDVYIRGLVVDNTWDTTVKMSYNAEKDYYYYDAQYEGPFKLYNNAAHTESDTFWNAQLGGTGNVKVSGDITLADNGLGGVNASYSGSTPVRIYATLDASGNVNLVTTVEPGTVQAKDIYIRSAFIGWETNDTKLTYVPEGDYYKYTTTGTGEFKIYDNATATENRTFWHACDDSGDTASRAITLAGGLEWSSLIDYNSRLDYNAIIPDTLTGEKTIYVTLNESGNVNWISTQPPVVSHEPPTTLTLKVGNTTVANGDTVSVPSGSEIELTATATGGTNLLHFDFIMQQLDAEGSVVAERTIASQETNGSYSTTVTYSVPTQTVAETPYKLTVKAYSIDPEAEQSTGLGTSAENPLITEANITATKLDTEKVYFDASILNDTEYGDGVVTLTVGGRNVTMILDPDLGSIAAEKKVYVGYVTQAELSQEMTFNVGTTSNTAPAPGAAGYIFTIDAINGNMWGSYDTGTTPTGSIDFKTDYDTVTSKDKVKYIFFDNSTTKWKEVWIYSWNMGLAQTVQMKKLVNLPADDPNYEDVVRGRDIYYYELTNAQLSAWYNQEGGFLFLDRSGNGTKTAFGKAYMQSVDIKDTTAESIWPGENNVKAEIRAKDYTTTLSNPTYSFVDKFNKSFGDEDTKNDIKYPFFQVSEYNVINDAETADNFKYRANINSVTNFYDPSATLYSANITFYIDAHAANLDNTRLYRDVMEEEPGKKYNFSFATKYADLKSASTDGHSKVYSTAFQVPYTIDANGNPDKIVAKFSIAAGALQDSSTAYYGGNDTTFLIEIDKKAIETGEVWINLVPENVAQDDDFEIIGYEHSSTNFSATTGGQILTEAATTQHPAYPSVTVSDAGYVGTDVYSTGLGQVEADGTFTLIYAYQNPDYADLLTAKDIRYNSKTNFADGAAADYKFDGWYKDNAQILAPYDEDLYMNQVINYSAVSAEPAKVVATYSLKSDDSTYTSYFIVTNEMQNNGWNLNTHVLKALATREGSDGSVLNTEILTPQVEVANYSTVSGIKYSIDGTIYKLTYKGYVDKIRFYMTSDEAGAEPGSNTLTTRDLNVSGGVRDNSVYYITDMGTSTAAPTAQGWYSLTYSRTFRYLNEKIRYVDGKTYTSADCTTVTRENVYVSARLADIYPKVDSKYNTYTWSAEDSTRLVSAAGIISPSSVQARKYTVKIDNENAKNSQAARNAANEIMVYGISALPIENSQATDSGVPYYANNAKLNNEVATYVDQDTIKAQYAYAVWLNAPAKVTTADVEKTFICWYDVDNNEIISYNSSYKFVVTQSASIIPVYSDNTAVDVNANGAARVNSPSYETYVDGGVDKVKMIYNLQYLVPEKTTNTKFYVRYYVSDTVVTDFTGVTWTKQGVELTTAVNTQNTVNYVLKTKVYANDGTVNGKYYYVQPYIVTGSETIEGNITYASPAKISAQ